MASFFPHLMLFCFRNLGKAAETNRSSRQVLSPGLRVQGMTGPENKVSKNLMLDSGFHFAISTLHCH